MNEIDKLKIEHARYKKALLCVSAMYGLQSVAGGTADAALNPPPPPPPPPATLQGILDKLEKLDKLDESSRYFRFHSIELFSDGSGSIRLGDKHILSRFDNIKSIVWDANT